MLARFSFHTGTDSDNRTPRASGSCGIVKTVFSPSKVFNTSFVGPPAGMSESISAYFTSRATLSIPVGAGGESFKAQGLSTMLLRLASLVGAYRYATARGMQTKAPSPAVGETKSVLDLSPAAR